MATAAELWSHTVMELWETLLADSYSSSQVLMPLVQMWRSGSVQPREHLVSESQPTHALAVFCRSTAM